MKSSSVPEVKKVFSESQEKTLRVSFADGDIFILELDHEVEASAYEEEGIWLCWIVKAVQGKHPDFQCLHKPISGLDIRECDVREIVDVETGTTLYGVA